MVPIGFHECGLVVRSVSLVHLSAKASCIVANIDEFLDLSFAFCKNFAHLQADQAAQIFSIFSQPITDLSDYLATFWHRQI